MKYLVVLVVLCGAIGLSHQKFSRDSIEEMINRVLADCGKREGASDSDIEFLKNRNLPESTQQKCLTACVGEDAEFIKGGTVDIPYVENLMKKAFGDDPKVGIAVEIAAICGKITDPDRCELVSKIYACSRDEFVKRDLKFEDFM